jgi:predicted PurR-regulated permease PerM
MSTDDLLGRIDERLKQVQSEIHHIQEGLKSANNKFEVRFDGMNNKFETRLEVVDDKIHNNSVEVAKNSMRFRILLGAIIPLTLSVFGLILQLVFKPK